MLRRLSLAGAAVGTLPRALADLCTLEALDLSGCKLSALPRAMGNLTRLRDLSSAFNPIETLPAELGQCTALEMLNFEGCRLARLAEDLTPRLTRLTALRLRGNPLEAVPPLAACTALKTLSIANVEVATTTRDENEASDDVRRNDAQEDVTIIATDDRSYLSSLGMTTSSATSKWDGFLALLFRSPSCQHPLLAAAVARLARDRTAHTAIVRAPGAQQQLLAMALSGSLPVVHCGCAALGALAVHHGGAPREWVGSAGAAPTVAALLATDADGALVSALRMLSDVFFTSAAAAESMLVLRDPDLLGRLIDLAQHTGAATVRRHALLCIGCAAIAPDVRARLLSDETALDIFFKLGGGAARANAQRVSDSGGEVTVVYEQDGDADSPGLGGMVKQASGLIRGFFGGSSGAGDNDATAACDDGEESSATTNANAAETSSSSQGHALPSLGETSDQTANSKEEMRPGTDRLDPLSAAPATPPRPIMAGAIAKGSPSPLASRGLGSSPGLSPGRSPLVSGSPSQQTLGRSPSRLVLDAERRRASLTPAPLSPTAILEAEEENARLANEAVRMAAVRALAILGCTEKVSELTGQRTRAKMQQTGVRVLSLDGGGMKGICTLVQLAALERAAGKRICEMFDLVVGTSIGGMLAVSAGLLRYPLDVLRDDILLGIGRTVFAKEAPGEGTADADARETWLAGLGSIGAGLVQRGSSGMQMLLRGVKYKSALLENFLKEYDFGHTERLDDELGYPSRLLASVDGDDVRVSNYTRMVDLASSIGGPRVALVSTSTRFSPAQPFLFRTYALPQHAAVAAQPAVPPVDPRCGTAGARAPALRPLRGSSLFNTWEAVRASTAGPYYFDEFSRGDEVFNDGAIGANNPALLAVREAQTLWPDCPIGVLVSIGTGRAPVKARERSSNWILAGGATLVEVACDTEVQDDILRGLLAGVNGACVNALESGGEGQTRGCAYYRFQPEADVFGCEIDESGDAMLRAMASEAEAYVERYVGAFADAARDLLDGKKGKEQDVAAPAELDKGTQGDAELDKGQRGDAGGYDYWPEHDLESADVSNVSDVNGAQMNVGELVASVENADDAIAAAPEQLSTRSHDGEVITRIAALERKLDMVLTAFTAKQDSAKYQPPGGAT